MKTWGIILSASVAMLAGLCGYLEQSPVVLWYRISTSSKALYAVMTLPQDHIDDFLQSYALFDKEQYSGEADARLIVNYYKVLNHLCAIGEVEKMYIPPVMDRSKGIFDNQVIWEERGMADKLDVGPGKVVLDIGCGRGRIAHHVASHTGAKVVGLNIDKTQIAMATEYAKATGLYGERLDFIEANYNRPLPFADQTFDGMYHVQAFTYAQDLPALFKELHRVLKPGAKMSFLDWFQLDAFNATDAHHQKIFRETKAVLGAVYTPTPAEYRKLLTDAGFEVVLSQEASEDGGYQYPLIESADKFYQIAKKLVDFLTEYKIIPAHFQKLLERLSAGGKSFMEADKKRMFTTSWQIIAQKPFKK